jgi:Tol biopolymer transport system component
LMQRRIWMTDVAGEAQPVRLTEGATYREERPLWSADGSHLLFARMDAKGRASLWLMAVAGGTPRQMVDELTPAPDPVDSYGHIDWEALFDWWRGV